MQAERLILNIGIQVQQFYRWLTNNSLTATEISLWHALMYIANEAGYPLWLSVSMSRLEKLTGMKKDAIYKAREGLVSKGRLEIMQGQGSQAAKYRIIPFEEDGEPTKPVDIPTTKEMPKDQPEQSIDYPLTELPETKVNIFRRMQELIPMPPSMDIHHIKQFIEEGMEDQLLCEAVDITNQTEEIKNRPPTEKWRYFKGIVRNWYNNGIMTLEQYQIHEKAREERIRNGSSKQNNRPIQPEPRESGMREFRIPE